MSDDNTTDSTDTTDQDNVDESQNQTGTDNPAGDDTTDWKAQARKHEQRAKENAAAARELAKLKQSQMSEVEKAATERDEARQAADATRAENARLRAAVKYKNLTEDDIETFLGGVPADKVDAAAKALSERIAKATPDASGAELGAGGKATPELDPRKIAEAAAKRGGSTF
ncbi:hypothetical protein [Rhodococcoides fascians]|uniref:hypothetical protein n=1 Tax=Rhodococcoides fascians TaxID=1828 RepID=UPI0006923B66|nr:hypothetical protein [Rhodococcus fascians]